MILSMGSRVRGSVRSPFLPGTSMSKGLTKGVMLAQLVKWSVIQADVQRFQPHLGHNWLSCGVFLVKSRHFGLPLAQTKGQIGNLSQRVARSLYKRGVFTKSIPEETRAITVPSLSGL